MRPKWSHEGPVLCITSGTQSEVVLSPPWVWIEKEIQMGLGQWGLEDAQFVFCGTHIRADCSEQGDTFIEGKAHHSQLTLAGQFIILVIDSTARDRLLTAL